MVLCPSIPDFSRVGPGGVSMVRNDLINLSLMLIRPGMGAKSTNGGSPNVAGMCRMFLLSFSKLEMSLELSLALKPMPNSCLRKTLAQLHSRHYCWVQLLFSGRGLAMIPR